MCSIDGDDSGEESGDEHDRREEEEEEDEAFAEEEAASGNLCFSHDYPHSILFFSFTIDLLHPTH